MKFLLLAIAGMVPPIYSAGAEPLVVAQPSSILNSEFKGSGFSYLPALFDDLVLDDVDGDGDADAWILAGGVFHPLDNQGTRAHPVWTHAPAVTPLGAGIPWAGLAFVDKDRDGDLDAILQPKEGDGYFCAENVGDAWAPAWSSEINYYPELGDSSFGFAQRPRIFSGPGPATRSLYAAGLAMNPGGAGGNDIIVARFDPAGSPGGPWSHRMLVSLRALGVSFAANHLSFVRDAASADWDRDGDRDLFLLGRFELVSGDYDGLILLENQGDDAAPLWAAPTFGPPAPCATATFPEMVGNSFASVDVNSDGVLDFVDASGVRKGIRSEPCPAWREVDRAFFRLAHGSFSHPLLVDLDGDARVDLLNTCNLATGRGVHWVKNIGSLSAPAWSDLGRLATQVPGFSQGQIALVDLDGDGFDDVFAASSSAGLGYALRLAGETDPHWAPLALPPVQWNLDSAAFEEFTFHDFDGDGDADLFRRLSGGTRAIQVLVNQGSPSAPLFGPPQEDPLRLADSLPGYRFFWPAFGDWNGDGLADFFFMARLLNAQIERVLYVCLKVPGPDPLAFQAPVRILALPEGDFPNFSCADLNHDGFADLVTGGSSGSLQLFLNSGSTLEPQPKNRTLTVRATQAFSAGDSGGGTGLVWRLVRNDSGAAISDAGLYQAGAATGLDIVEVSDPQGQRGRAFVQVTPEGSAAEAGHALLIAGSKSSSDPVRETADRMVRRAYETLRLKGLTKDNITYLAPDSSRDLDGNGLADDIDGEPSLASVRAAFTNALAGTDRLLVHLVDHGSTNATEAFLRLNPAEQLPAAELKEMLDHYQDATSNEVVVVMDFCYAGEFARRLADPSRTNRILLASCAGNQLAYFIARGLVSYSDLLFNALLAGADLLTAHNLARGAMDTYQQAWLDDNGDGESSPDADGIRAAARTVGVTTSAGRDLPRIGSISPNQECDRDQPALIWASDITGASALARVWAVVVPPFDAAGDPRTDPVLDLPEIPLFFNPETGRHEAELRGLKQPGLHKVIVFAQDVWDGVSFPRQSLVRQGGYEEKAVVVHTGPADGPAAQAATQAFRVLRARLLASADIAWLGAGPVDADGDGTNDVDAAATLAGLGQALSPGLGTADKVTVCLVGASSSDRLLLDGPLAPSVLAQWLDVARLNRPDQEQAVVLDFAGASAALPFLGASNRVVLSSSAPGRPAVLTPGASFTGFFFAEIAAGRPVGEAAGSAKRAIRRYSANLRQKASLDGNGNGVANEKGLDAVAGNRMHIGAAFLSGDDLPGIGRIAPDQELFVGATAMVWADDVTDAEGIQSVWVDISPPTNSQGAVSARLNLVHNAASQRWEGVATGLHHPGVYTLGYQARDNGSRLSQVVQGRILVGNPPPGGVPDAFEPDADCAAAALADLPVLRIRGLHQSNDVDTLIFHASSNLVYDIETVHLTNTIDTVIEIHRVYPDGSTLLVERIDESGVEEGELGGLDYPEDGLYCIRVSHAQDTPFAPGDYALVVHVPAGFSGINVTVRNIASQSTLAGATAQLYTLAGNLLQTLPVDAAGVAKFIQPVGNYRVGVTPPPGFFPLFHPTNSANVPELPDADLGNPRHLEESDYGTLSYGGNSGSPAAYLGFYFFPGLIVTGRVVDAVTHEPLSNVGLTLRRTTDHIDFDRYPWTSYGTAWETVGGLFPPRVILPAGSTYDLTLTRAGYASQTLLLSGSTHPVLDAGRLGLGALDGDQDGLPDAWESVVFGGLGLSAGDDPDGDLHTNLQEFQAGTHPGQSASVFRLGRQGMDNGGVTLHWTASSARRYWVYEGPTPSGPWSLREELIAPQTQNGDAVWHGPLGVDAGFFLIQSGFLP